MIKGIQYRHCYVSKCDFVWVVYCFFLFSFLKSMLFCWKFRTFYSNQHIATALGLDCCGFLSIRSIFSGPNWMEKAPINKFASFESGELVMTVFTCTQCPGNSHIPHLSCHSGYAVCTFSVPVSNPPVSVNLWILPVSSCFCPLASCKNAGSNRSNSYVLVTLAKRLKFTKGSSF